ncbi:MPK5 [Symbiodinium sp. CCMP2592]|nr:MPK5 [Symbiodinium sp. CCMP2592]
MEPISLSLLAVSAPTAGTWSWFSWLSWQGWLSLATAAGALGAGGLAACGKSHEEVETVKLHVPGAGAPHAVPGAGAVQAALDFLHGHRRDVETALLPAHWKLDRKLGQGASGCVYAVCFGARQYAVKRIEPPSDKVDALTEYIGTRWHSRDFLHQIRAICEVIGTPLDDELAWLGAHFENAKKFVEQHCCSLRRQDWAIMFPIASSEQLELLNKLLAFDPTRRLVAHDALQHACLKDVYDAEDDSFSVKHWSWDDGGGDVPSLWKKIDAVPLYGGALTCELPRTLTDASAFREVPDHQEVWVDTSSDRSVVIEILEAKDPNGAALSLAGDDDENGEKKEGSFLIRKHC